MSRRRKTLLGGLLVAATDFTTDLVASWQLSGDYTDYTGNHDATKTGTVNFIAGKVDNAALFDGSSDYLTVTDHADFSFTDGNDVAFSMACWVKFDVVQNCEFINKRNPAGTGREWMFDYTGTAYRLLIMSLSDTPNNNIKIEYTTTPTVDVWYHIVVTYDGSETKEGFTMYVDGADVSGTQSEVGTYTGMTDGTSDVIIATRAWDVANGELDGALDEMKVYKGRELTAVEVLEMYTSENAGTSVLPP